MNPANMNPGRLAKIMASENGIEELMMQPVYENEYGYYSQAELLADVINILRMDIKRIGAAHDVHLDIKKIQADKVAWLLAQMVDGNTQPMLTVFNDIEDSHHAVMEATLSDEEFREYLEFKESQLNTVQPEANKPDPEEVEAEIEEAFGDVDEGEPAEVNHD